VDERVSRRRLLQLGAIVAGGMAGFRVISWSKEVATSEAITSAMHEAGD
jgi:hypothetical protein